MHDDGVIKYDLSAHQTTGPLDESVFFPLERWRKKLHQLNLIGEYPESKIGFGNLSLRLKIGTADFVITGTQTGALSDLDGSHYCLVHHADFEKNQLFSEGPTHPSSEALTHASLYQEAPHIMAIFHIHDPELWRELPKMGVAKTDDNIEYGTLAMASAVKKFVISESGIFVMGGHEDGVIIFGSHPDQVGTLLLDMHRRVKGIG
jgi:hypothetical protein